MATCAGNFGADDFGMTTLCRQSLGRQLWGGSFVMTNLGEDSVRMATVEKRNFMMTALGKAAFGVQF